MGDAPVKRWLQALLIALLVAVASACEAPPPPPPPAGPGTPASPPAEAPSPVEVPEPIPGLAIPAPALPATVPVSLIPFPQGWALRSVPQPVTGRRGAVSTTDAYASEVGLDVLRRGGNAVDAAVAAAFALAVVNPEAGNLGGGGFLVLHLADGTQAALDFRETAPAGATRDMFLDEDGELTDRSIVGHLASGVPGSVRGLWEAHQRHGSLPWEALLDPSVELAEEVVVTERMATMFRESRAGLELFETTRQTFLPGGHPPERGDTFRQPELAATLRRIRDLGPDGFYGGETAALIVAEMERGGGLITLQDLAEYRAVWRDPVVFTYRGHTLVSMPPSSSGGATLAALLNILEGYDLRVSGWNTPATIHLVAEAAKRAYADRNELLADPAFQPLPFPRMLSKEYAVERRGEISPGVATPSLQVHPRAEEAPREGEHTTHLSVVDGEGNAVSLTTTINSWFGSKVTVEGAGFVLNNEMDDFAARPGTPNQFGLVQGVRNAVEPGKRMLSAMTPTVVLDPDGNLLMVVGTPGGSTIITTVLQVISNILDHGMDLPAAVHAPRVHHQHLPDQIFYEPGGLGPDLVAALEGMGHALVERNEMSGDVQAILVRPDGTLAVVSDPRRGGTAKAW